MRGQQSRLVGTSRRVPATIPPPSSITCWGRRIAAGLCGTTLCQCRAGQRKLVKRLNFPHQTQMGGSRRGGENPLGS